MQDKKINIYISCHKKCYTPVHPMIKPIQVGSALAKNRLEGMLHDDEGENISEKNKMYCELTGQYWAWKHEEADYYGFFHYRRYLSFADEEFEENPFRDACMPFLSDKTMEELNLSEEVLQREIPKYDIITTKPVKLKKLGGKVRTNYLQYVKTPYQYKEDLDLLLDIIKERYPEYYDTAVYYLKKSPIGYYCNMFIMKKEIFNDYSSWLFDILAEHEKRSNYENYNVDAYRISGYLGERLFGIYYLYWKNKKGVRCKELQRTLFLNTDEKEKCTPAFKDNNIAIALAANDYFAPYLCVTLKSIIDNSTELFNYDVIILTRDISADNRKILMGLARGRDNISIRFLDPTYVLDGYTFMMHGHFGSVETFYRLILSEVLPEYEKILYVDSDMVVQDDLAKLYNEDVDGYLLAATRDADTAGLYNGYEPKKKKYTDEIMKLKDPYSYFQAGILLINLEEFRKSFKVESVLKLATEREWQLQDQDVLNILCEDRVKFVDMSWNVLVDYAHVRMNKIMRLAPQWLYFEYMEARKYPKVIHYAGPEKPWNCPEMDYGKVFWEYAKGTPFYETMLFRMAYKLNIDSTKHKKTNIVAGGIQCIKDHGFIYTIKYLPKRLTRSNTRK